MSVESGFGDQPSKMGRREFLRRGGIMLGAGVAVAGGVSMVSGMIEGVTQPKFNPNWAEEAALYPEVYSSVEISEANKYVRQYEEGRRGLELQGRINEIPDLADGVKLANSYRIVKEETQRMGSLWGLREDWRRKMSDMEGRIITKSMGGLLAVEVGLGLCALIMTSPPDASNEQTASNQNNTVTASS